MKERRRKRKGIVNKAQKARKKKRVEKELFITTACSIVLTVLFLVEYVRNGVITIRAIDIPALLSLLLLLVSTIFSLGLIVLTVKTLGDK